MNEQPSGFSFDPVTPDGAKVYECPICLCLIKGAIELPCEHLSCTECLVFYEMKQLERDDTAKYYCSICNREYKVQEKKTVKSVDKIIQTSIMVKCKQIKCKWTGCIMDYKDHKKKCDYFEVECTNTDCKAKIARNDMNKHLNECEYRPTPCQFCQIIVPLVKMEDHSNVCKNFPVSCKNIGCQENLRRNEVEQHCRNVCEFEQIDCLYHNLGCNAKIERRHLKYHNDLNNIIHQELLIKTTVDLSGRNNELEVKLQQQQTQIEQLECDKLSNKKAIDKIQQRMTSMEDSIKLKDQEIKEQNNKINNLETFALRMSKLQQTLSDKEVNLHLPDFERLEEKDYDKDDNVKEWRQQVEENKNDQNQCDYLQNLQTAVKNYEVFIHPSTYSSRMLYTIRNFMENSIYYFHNTEETVYVKLKWCIGYNKLCVRLFDDVNEYFRQTLTNGWITHSSFVKSFCEKRDCVHYALLSPFLENLNIWLIGINDEKKLMKLTNGEKTDINLLHYTTGSFIFLKLGQ